MFLESTYPVISVIIPCFNSEATISKCLKSLQNQTIQKWEALCIDDGCQDNTLSILQSLNKSDPRIKIFSQLNSGAAHARSVGISFAKGNFITFIDSDDTVEPKYLESMLFAALSDSKVDLVVTSMSIVNGGKKRSKKYTNALLTQQIYLKSILTGKYGWELCGKLYRAELFREPLHTPENLSIGEDAFHFIQIVCRVRNVKIIDYSGYNYIRHRGSISKIGSKRLANETIQAALHIDNLLSRKDFYPKISNEIMAMYLLFYSNATRRGGIGWANSYVEKIYRECFRRQTLQLIPVYKAIYVSISLFLAKLIGKL